MGRGSEPGPAVGRAQRSGGISADRRTPGRGAFQCPRVGQRFGRSGRRDDSRFDPHRGVSTALCREVRDLLSGCGHSPGCSISKVVRDSRRHPQSRRNESGRLARHLCPCKCGCWGLYRNACAGSRRAGVARRDRTAAARRASCAARCSLVSRRSQWLRQQMGFRQCDLDPAALFSGGPETPHVAQHAAVWLARDRRFRSRAGVVGRRGRARGFRLVRVRRALRRVLRRLGVQSHESAQPLCRAWNEHRRSDLLHAFLRILAHPCPRRDAWLRRRRTGRRALGRAHRFRRRRFLDQCARRAFGVSRQLFARPGQYRKGLVRACSGQRLDPNEFPSLSKSQIRLQQLRRALDAGRMPDRRRFPRRPVFP
ncbi:MAG: hypothetical protein BWZ10_03006 [candidate division BRC1 bacterium ADurb.BinA364]|nr:MAG: hypothetical protein BWZ10_03006 [candidate division BRC1 bacterium ADurb.BinA364]